MTTYNQDEIVIELTINDNAPEKWRDEPPRYIRLKSYTAQAFVEMFDAGRFGVHIGRFNRDALARLDQAGVPYELFYAPKRGTKNRDWCRLNFGEALDVRLVAEGEA